MPLAVLIPLLLQAAPAIYTLGKDAIKAYKTIANALKVQVGTPEEQALLDQIEAQMHKLDKEVAEAPEPD